MSMCMYVCHAYVCGDKLLHMISSEGVRTLKDKQVFTDRNLLKYLYLNICIHIHI